MHELKPIMKTVQMLDRCKTTSTFSSTLDQREADEQVARLVEQLMTLGSTILGVTRKHGV